MPSSLPMIVVVLALTGGTGALWRLWVLLSDRRSPETPGAAGDTERLFALLGVLAQLGWAVFFLAHFVFLLALAESKEISWRLSVAASIVGIACAACSLGSLGGAIRRETRMRASRRRL